MSVHYNSQDLSQYWDGLIDISPPEWIVSMEYIKNNTPSRKSSNPEKQTSFEEEMQKRIKGVYYIFNCSRHLHLSRSVSLMAAIYLQRFYLKMEVKSYHYYDVGAASIFIACKAEESRRKMSDVVKLCVRVALGNKEQIDESSKIFWKRKATITNLEEIILDVFSFDVTPENPYRLVTNALGIGYPNDFKSENSDQNRELFTHCINYLEIIYRIPVCLLYTTEYICALALVYASQKTKIPLKENFLVEKFNIESENLFNCYKDVVQLAKFTNMKERVFNIVPLISIISEDNFKSVASGNLS